jgi:hypothetical protein
LRPGARSARLTLQIHQLGGLYRQRGEVAAKGFGNYFLRPRQMLAAIHQIGCGLHSLRAADRFQNRCHGIGMRQRVFAVFQSLEGNQRFGERASPRQRIGLIRQAGRRGLDDGRALHDRHRRMRSGTLWQSGMGFHRRNKSTQQKAGHRFDLVRRDDGGRMTDAVKLDQPRMWAALRHRKGCIHAEQV